MSRKNRNEVLIRVDGNSRIGLGHLVRCYALAQMLQEQYAIQFYCREITLQFERELTKSGFKVSKIENEAVFTDQIQQGKIVVLDGYDFDVEYMKRIKSKGAKLVVIDDLYDKTYCADLILNYSPAADKVIYNALPSTLFALGLDYALLRKTFLTQALIPRTINKINTVLVCFGGADPQNYTLNALNILVKSNAFSKIIVIVGSGYIFHETLRRVIQSDSRINLKQSLSEQEMTAALIESELVISSASGLALEALCCGCIPLIGITADNQINFHNALTEKFSIRSFGNNINSFQSVQLLESLNEFGATINANTNDIKCQIAKSPGNIRSIFSTLAND